MKHRSLTGKSVSKYIVLIGDIVASRRLRATSRRTLQQHFMGVLKSLNEAMTTGLVSDLTITLGDEFECVLRPEYAGSMIPDLIWILEKELAGVSIRFGIGMGGIDTEIGRNPLTMDGPAFHTARAAIQKAANEEKLGGVFQGFGSEADVMLNGMARVLHRQRREWSPQQRRVANLLRDGKRQHEAADILNVSRQAVSAYARNAAWAAYAEGEEAWRIALAGASAGRLYESA